MERPLERWLSLRRCLGLMRIPAGYSLRLMNCKGLVHRILQVWPTSRLYNSKHLRSKSSIL